MGKWVRRISFSDLFDVRDVYLCVCHYLVQCVYLFVCMYVCIYVCTHTRTHEGTYVSVCVCLYVCMCVCMYTRTHERTYAYMYVCMYERTYICMYLYCMYDVCVYMCMFVCMYVCTYLYMYLSHAANQRPGLPLHILRYATGSIPLSFPVLLAGNSLLGSI